MLNGALGGVKVLDLSEDIAGSFCARLLADYGAEVLKLEPPAGPPYAGWGLSSRTTRTRTRASSSWC